jgi:serine protease Do
MLARAEPGRARLAVSLFLALLLSAPAWLRAADPTTVDPASPAIDVDKIFAGAVPTSVAELKAMQQRVQELSQRVIQCTVNVQIGPAQGSGVIVSKDGYVMTAAHVNGAPNRDVVFTFPDGSKKKGKTLGVDRRIDSGLMKITDPAPDGGEWPCVEMGDSKSLAPGQWVLATGHPGGYQRGRKPVVRLGRVLLSNNGVIMTDCPLVGGDSGGPLFDMSGKVIGIHSRISEEITQNMHVPVATYTEHWDDLVAAKTLGAQSRAFIGVVRDEEADDARIAEVAAESPAEKAGVKPGDVITRFDGKEVTTFESLVELVGEKRPGDKVKIEVKRGDDTFLLDLVIGRLGG